MITMIGSWVFAIIGTPITLFLLYAEGMKTVPKRLEPTPRMIALGLPLASLFFSSKCLFDIFFANHPWWEGLVVILPIISCSFCVWGVLDVDKLSGK